MNYLKIFISLLLVAISFLVFFQDKFEVISDTEYNDRLEFIINIDYETEALEDEALQQYHDSIIQINGKYIEISKNWREGLFFITGSLLVLVFVIEDVIRNNRSVKIKQ
ncbi:hypothetical protein ACAG96_06430 [Candidatus Izemoplasma sp. B36]|uniref:hypothetical protein n=1 Tax=Candidatus Izemoplasma sp. B36 TaxID=3242468 RepID=UPI0035571E8D